MKKNVKQKNKENSLQKSNSFQLGKPSYAGKLLDSALAKLSAEKLIKPTQSTLDRFSCHKSSVTKSSSKEKVSNKSFRNTPEEICSDRKSLIKQVKELYEECVLSENSCEPTVALKLVNQISQFVENAALDKTAIKDIIGEHLLLKLDSLTNKYKDRFDENKTLCYKKELKLQVLLRFESKIASAEEIDDSLDAELVDQCSELIERLVLCTTDKKEWKLFLKDKLVDKYKDNLALNLSHIYLSIGQEPPDCLPEITSESELSTTSNLNNSIVDIEGEKKAFQAEISPRLIGRLDLGLFANESENSLLLAACSTSHQSSGSGPMTAGSILTSGNCRVLRSSDHSNSNPPAPTANNRCLTALMTTTTLSKHSRRKPSTPTKRILTSPNSQSNPSKRRKRSSSKSRSRGEKKSKTTSSRRFVKDTPHRESRPRWERAKLAAAKKIGDKKIVVSESPAKLKNPLERSQSLSLLTSYTKYSHNQTRLSIINQDSTGFSRSNSFVTSAAPPSQSSVMQRAAAWRMKQAEQEISLSQYFIGDSCDGESSSNQHSVGPHSMSMDNSLPCSSNLALRKRSSNLFANFSPGECSDGENTAPSLLTSPQQFTSPRKQDPVGNLMFTPTKGILKSLPLGEANISSPPPSGAASRSVLLSPKVRRRTFCDTKPPQVFYEDTMFMDEKEFFTHSGSKKSPRTRRTSNSKSGLTPTYNRTAVGSESPSRPRPCTRRSMSNAPSLPPWLKKKGGDYPVNDCSESSASGHMLRRRLFGEQQSNCREPLPFCSLSRESVAESNSNSRPFGRSESERSLGFQVSNIDLNRAMQ